MSIAWDTPLLITHNAGFFSCSTVALEKIAESHRATGRLPILHRSQQYEMHRSSRLKWVVPHFYDARNDVRFQRPVRRRGISMAAEQLSADGVELQFSDYRDLNFAYTNRLLSNYFAPSEPVLKAKTEMLRRYRIRPDRTVAVLYRGTDKLKESPPAPFEAFADRVEAIVRRGGERTVLVQTDTRGLRESLESQFASVVHAQELAPMARQDVARPALLARRLRTEDAQRFLAMLLILAECASLVTTSGNVGLWATLYRGHARGLHQWASPGLISDERTRAVQPGWRTEIV